MSEDIEVMDERDKALARLRESFPPEVVGKLPRVTCTACSEANKRNRGTTCDKHQKAKCQVCGGYISTAHIHLDFVGHADTTDRLLSVDPEWSWEPFATDADGLPAIVNSRLWIRLTILGVTRIGVGSVEPGALDAEKQLIGDAIRNAAMRFGVALDLWAKGDLESMLAADAPAPAAATKPQGNTVRRPPALDADRATGEVTTTTASTNGLTSVKAVGGPVLLTARELADELRARGLDPNGTKAELAARLADALDPPKAADMAEATELFSEEC